MEKKKKILLIIEDDGFVLKALSEGLSRRGFEIIGVQDGGEGIKAIEKHKPDMVVLDLILPTMTGEEILAAKEKIKRIKNIPVLVLTNKEDPDSREVCLRHECVTGYLIKANFSFDTIEKSILAGLKK